METKFNFKSAICTSKVQSERLLALGLKKETADMFWWDNGYGSCAVISRPAEKEDGEYGKVIPAWSMHRLIEMVAHTQYPYYVISKELPIYDALCERIAWLIKEGYFNKEYLEE